MTPVIVLIVYCVLIVLASLAGGCLPVWIRLTHTRMQIMMSFVGGLMLGVALLHLLPHGAIDSPSIDWLVGWTLAGLLAMFFLIRVSHVHGHGPAEDSPLALSNEQHAAHETCGHAHALAPSPGGAHSLSWMGLAIGLSLHTLIDGVALAAAVAADAHVEGTWLLGAGAFLAVLLHKPLDSMSITSLAAAGGWSREAVQAVNWSFALLCPAGAFAFFFGVSELTAADPKIVAAALGFAAGVFLCIALADILPEVSFHSHDRGVLSVALLLGVLLAYGIGFLEPEGAHDHSGHSHGENAEQTSSLGNR